MTRSATDGDALERTVLDRRDPLVGQVLDQRFRIDFQLAAGGFGAIYRATDVRSDAEVALKVLLPKLARDPMVLARFRREGKMLAALRDPHTITAYELGEARDGTLYIVMELLHGESLYERFRSTGPLPWRRVVHIARGVCSSLAEAHAFGVVHRDLKPANIHLEHRDNDPDFVKVLDFGIAKIVQGNGIEHTQLTQAGQMIGTVDYMSPEQMVGGEMTPARDIYTLGLVMYEMIAGRTPFADAQTATAILASVLTQAAPPLSQHAQVPATLEQIVARCLEREPANRYRDVSDLAEALAAVAAAGLARPSPVPRLGFDEPVLTSEATRIDVRYTESSRPVLDARGPRRQITPPDAPSPVASPAELRGSQRAPAPAETHRPAGPVYRTVRQTPPPPIAMPSPVVMPPAMMPPAMMPAPLATPPGTMPQVASPLAWPPPVPGAPVPMMQLPSPMQLPAPPARLPSYTAPSYDMTEVASYDQMVRRIIYVVAVVIAVIAAAVIATR